jgi:DNA polymerase III epsilon subunit family exonuclease
VSYPDLETPLRDLTFVAFDTETTGLLPTVDRIVEIAAVKFRLGEEIDTFDELVNPGREIGLGAARVHGIDAEEVRDKPPIAEVLPRFSAFARDSVLLAHNAEFDVTFLAHERLRAPGCVLPNVPVVDTVEVSKALRPDLPNHKLETISKAIGCPAPTYHRALADAQTLAACFERLLTPDLNAGRWHQLVATAAGALTFGRDDKLRMWLPPRLRALEEALESGDKVTILYEPEGKRHDTRDIRPKGYMRRSNGTFLMAYCERDKADRSFRLDWITRAQHAQASLF